MGLAGGRPVVIAGHWTVMLERTPLLQRMREAVEIVTADLEQGGPWPLGGRRFAAVAVANYLPHSLVILSAADLAVERIFEAKDRAGQSSRVSAVYQAMPRNSFMNSTTDSFVTAVCTSAEAVNGPAPRRNE